MTTQDFCRICQAPLNAYPLGEKNGYSLVSCRACGSVLVDPWMKKETVESYFGEIEPQITHIPNYERHVLRLVKKISKILPDRNRRDYSFLDVGAQNGYAVIAAKQLGLQAKGIDSHEFFVDFAKTRFSPDMFEHMTPAEYASARKPQVDIVYAHECFCEQTDMEEFVAALARIVTPGGILYIEEPDGNHFRLPRKFTSWPVVFPPLNFVYLSKRGMKKLLGRHGFRVRKSFFSWRPYMRLIAVKK